MARDATDGFTQEAVSAELRKLHVPSKPGRDKSLPDADARPRGAYLDHIRTAIGRRDTDA